MVGVVPCPIRPESAYSMTAKEIGDALVEQRSAEPVVSLGNSFDFGSIVGVARAGIDNKHATHAQEVAKQIVTIDNDGVITYGKHNVDMSREKLADGTSPFSDEQLGARSAKGAMQKETANALTIEQSNEQAKVAIAKLKKNKTMRCVGVEKLGKHKYAVVFYDTAGSKSTITLQKEVLAEPEKKAEFEDACNMGAEEALAWIQSELLSLD